MTKKQERIVAARERLKSPVQARGREDSVSADTAELKNEIRRQRALGKTWKQIAQDIYEDEKFADAIRAAFGRLSPKPANAVKAKPVKREQKADTPATEPATSLATESSASTADRSSPFRSQPEMTLFGAQHDARDDQARAAELKGGA